MFYDSQNPKELREILSQNCVPSEALVRDLERYARLERFERGDVVLRQGEVCDDFVINRFGLFRVGNVTEDSEDTILFGTSGDVFTSLHSWYAGEPAIFSLSALEPSEAWLVSYARVRELLARYPEFKNWMLDLLTEQMFGFEKRYLFYNNKSAEERLLNFLKIQYGSLRRAPVKFISRTVPLKYIAQYLKITQSTLSRLRRKLVSGDEK